VTATVRIPTPLRSATGGASTVDVEGGTVGEVLKNLDAAHPGIGQRLLDEQGEIRRFVNVFVEDVDAHYERAVAEGAEITMEPRSP
jgi:sulfur-carrier protein